MHFAKQKYKFNENETKSRMENPPPPVPHTQFSRDKPCASSYLKIAN